MYQTQPIYNNPQSGLEGLVLQLIDSFFSEARRLDPGNAQFFDFMRNQLVQNRNLIINQVLNKYGQQATSEAIYREVGSYYAYLCSQMAQQPQQQQPAYGYQQQPQNVWAQPIAPPAPVYYPQTPPPQTPLFTDPRDKANAPPEPAKSPTANLVDTILNASSQQQAPKTVTPKTPSTASTLFPEIRMTKSVTSVQATRIGKQDVLQLSVSDSAGNVDQAVYLFTAVSVSAAAASVIELGATGYEKARVAIASKPSIVVVEGKMLVGLRGITSLELGEAISKIIDVLKVPTASPVEKLSNLTRCINKMEFTIASYFRRLLTYMVNRSLGLALVTKSAVGVSLSVDDNLSETLDPHSSDMIELMSSISPIAISQMYGTIFDVLTKMKSHDGGSYRQHVELLFGQGKISDDSTAAVLEYPEYVFVIDHQFAEILGFPFKDLLKRNSPWQASKVHGPLVSSIIPKLWGIRLLVLFNETSCLGGYFGVDVDDQITVGCGPASF